MYVFMLSTRQYVKGDSLQVYLLLRACFGLVVEVKKLKSRRWQGEWKNFILHFMVIKVKL